MTTPLWQPSASLENLTKAANLRTLIRNHMNEAGVLEVSTPAISTATTTDPQLHSISLDVNGQTAYLHTSPEFAMKRLLATHGQDIYQITSVFRDAEIGRKHNPEFTMFEWYRVGMDHHQLMDSIDVLMQDVFTAFDLPWHKPTRQTYSELVEAELGVEFALIDVGGIKQHFIAANRSFPDAELSLDAALDIFIDTFVLPKFAEHSLTYICDYPPSQAALARTAVNDAGVKVAQRFELYCGSLEIANGYHELNDVVELKRRVERDLMIRRDAGLHTVIVDAHMISAHQSGLPDCAGVAMGLDRLLMLVCHAQSIDQVIAFPIDRA